MNQFDTTLQIILPFICLWELLVALFAWLLDRYARANRYLVWMLALLALNGFAQSQMAAAANITQARPWTYILAATTLAININTLVVTFSLLRPDDWPQGPRKRWLWRLIHVLVFIPALLTLGDVLFNTRLFYTGLDPGTYQAHLADNVYTQGALSQLIILSIQHPILLASLALVITTLRDPQAAPIFRQRARWLLVMQLVTPLLIFGSRALAGDLASTTVTGLFLAIAYALMILRGMISDRVLRQRLANVSLNLKLYAGLGVSIFGLFVIGGLTVYSGTTSQRLVDRTLNRQRQLTNLASDIKSNLFDIQNEVFAFYNSWSLTGFEKSYQVGFENAQETYLTELEEKLRQIDTDISKTLELNPGPETRTNLERIVQNINAYELTILEMNDHMARRGFYTSGQIGQIQEVLAELQERLDEPGLEPILITLLQTDQQMKDFFLRSELSTALVVHELTQQQKEQVAAADDNLLSPTDKIQLDDLITDLDDLFFAASSEQTQLRENRNNLIEQSDLTSVLVSQLFRQQQSAFDATVERLQLRQSDTTITITGLLMLTIMVSISALYFVVEQVTHPAQELGQAANRLGDGELSVRASVHGRDEIGATAAALNLMADRLQELLAGLENQVAARTHELERYSGYLEASTEVGRTISSILERDELIQQVVESVRDRFGFYYVGLFLKDETNEWAVLQAGTGQAGQALLAREYRLHIGGGSIVGWSIEHGQARVAKLDEAFTMYLTISELPDTRSEAAIPLQSRGQVRGALSVHHAEPDAFGPDIITALQMVADQVAIALDNATLFTESLVALEVAQRSYGELSRRAWLTLLRAGPELGFHSDEHSVTKVTDAPRLATEPTDPTQGGDGAETKYALSIPIKVGDEVIGALDTYKPGEAGRWRQEEIDMMQEIVAQLALALDSARLHQSTRTRAYREQLMAQITARMRETLDVETVLRTAVEEIYEALDLSDLAIYLSPERPEH
ncbi:MAG: GAF domain-containing protein [Anaerolineae bacterium]|jgi:GAF domain-containing protein/HAMP domain-containing protein